MEYETNTQYNIQNAHTHTHIILECITHPWRVREKKVLIQTTNWLVSYSCVKQYFKHIHNYIQHHHARQCL